MKLKKDWSLAYFLYYICWLGYWTIILSFVTVLLSSGIFYSAGYFRVLNIPVTIHSEQFSPYDDLEKDGISIHIPESVHTHIDVSVETKGSMVDVILLFAVKFFDGLIAFLVFYFLSLVLKKVAEKDPFHPDNSSHLYTVGWIMIIAGCLALLLILLPIPLFEMFHSSSSEAITNFNLRGDLYIVGGVITIVISYVFKEGAQLYNEQKLTV